MKFKQNSESDSDRKAINNQTNSIQMNEDNYKIKTKRYVCKKTNEFPKQITYKNISSNLSYIKLLNSNDNLIN